MANFHSLPSRIIVNWHIIVVFTIALISIHFFFLNDYHLQVKETLAGVVSPPAPQTTSTAVISVHLDSQKGEDGSKEPLVSTTPQEQSQPIPESIKNAATSSEAATESPTNSTKEYLAICLSVRDQVRDLPEWLTHHYHHIGIRRFYIMDDGSDPPISSHDIDFGIPKSAMTFHYQERETRVKHQQLEMYDRCQKFWGDQHKWIAYLDGDEFLEATGNETVQEVLQSFDADETVGALGVHWKMHNSNGLLTRPESARKGFTSCLWDSPESYKGGHDDNHHLKSIVKTSKYAGWENPHKFHTKPGSNTVREHGQVVTSDAWGSPITRDRIALHHYATKSRQEYEEKMHRGNGMGDPKKEDWWLYMETKVPVVVCNEMAKYDP